MSEQKNTKTHRVKTGISDPKEGGRGVWPKLVVNGNLQDAKKGRKLPEGKVTTARGQEYGGVFEKIRSNEEEF